MHVTFRFETPRTSTRYRNTEGDTEVRKKRRITKAKSDGLLGARKRCSNLLTFDQTHCPMRYTLIIEEYKNYMDKKKKHKLTRVTIQGRGNVFKSIKKNLKNILPSHVKKVHLKETGKDIVSAGTNMPDYSDDITPRKVRGVPGSGAANAALGRQALDEKRRQSTFTFGLQPRGKFFSFLNY